MTNGQISFIVTLLCLSVIILLIPCVLMIVRKLATRPSRAVVQKSGMGRVLAFSACLITSVWCLRYAVGYYSAVNPIDPSQALTWGEEIFNSIVHALQSFSMDEDYTQYIITGKMMMRDIFGESTALQGIYGMYASILNFVAPVVGGAIIFEILASVFPRIKLRLCHLAVWRDKYYFSKLNEGSLVLAKSIWLECKSRFKKPVIIFCDAYVDSDDERNTEMLQEAKIIGGICVSDDISHVSKNKVGIRKFFIIDENEPVNLQALTSLSSPANNRYLKNAEIFLFTTDDAYIQVEKSVRDKLEKDYGFTNDELPAFIPVDSYRNLVSNLLVDIPLYEPLIGREKNADGTRDLNVTILGTGHIGTEMFLSTYWFGQILNCNLIINVLSQETEEEFWSKIDYINPEIKHTTIENDPILKIYSNKEEYSPVYCKVNYTQCDVKSSRFIELLTDEEKGILNTDYFLVSIGSDEDNMSVANTVREYIGQYHLSESTLDRTVIAYVVYNSELQDSLNRQKRHCFFNDKTDVYTCAIGSYREVYSMRNVFMTEHDLTAQLMQDYYFAMQDTKRIEKHKKRMKDDYKHWASLARAMHVKYKMFSADMLDLSLLDYDDPTDEEYVNHVKERLEKYKKTIAGEFCTEKTEADHINFLHRMSWLEHRRWNSFTRVKGFRYTGHYDAYVRFDENGKCISGSYKQMDIKLHPCLVECDAKGVRGILTKDGKITDTFNPKYEDDLDLLDELSYDLYKKKYNDYDFKIYDYPNSDF